MNRNGFILSDAIVAALVAMMVFIPALGLLQSSIHMYERAKEIREAAMYGRNVMERSRLGLCWPKRVFHDEYKGTSGVYAVDAYSRDVNEVFCCHVIEVTTPHGEVHTFKRLARRQEP